MIKYSNAIIPKSAPKNLTFYFLVVTGHKYTQTSVKCILKQQNKVLRSFKTKSDRRWSNFRL